jgi:putative colanic acid biosynthesis acetyltransferase WcaF
LPYAIRSVIGWANKVMVLDSGSTDGSQQVARDLGAELFEHPWEGYAKQKNWGLDNLPFESPWVFILDADESITPELRDEIVRISSIPPEHVEEAGFYVNRFLVFMGKRIRHCGYFPSWNLRLFKRGAARYEERPVHEHMILQGREGYLRGLMAHEDHRSLEYYIAKHNRYSTLEAETIFFGQKNGQSGVQASLFGNAIQRRRYFKNNIYPKLPAKWLGRFIWMYFIRLGIFDGVAGLRFCLLISSHELFTALKLRELQQRFAKAAREGKAVQDTSAVQVVDQFIRPAENEPAAAPAPHAGDNGAIVTRDADESAVPVPAAEAQSPDEVVALRTRSPWGLHEKVKRVVWMMVRATLFRPSFHNWYGWRRFLLRCFGAKIGSGVRIRPTVWVEIPWNLDIGDDTAVGDYAILYSLGRITIGKLAVVSQYAHLCAGTHDYTIRTFPLLRLPIRVGDEAWVAADAFVGPGVRIGARSVVGARATVVKDVPDDVVVAGNPARVVKPRLLRD